MITATLGLNNAPFQQGLKGALSALATFKADTTKLIAGAAGFAAMASAIAGQFAKMRATMELGDELADLALSTGQPIRQLIVLRKAFTLSGMAADDVVPMIARLQKALAGVNEQGEPTNKVFEKLGLSVDRLKTMTATQQIRELQKAFAEIKNPSERTAAAMQIYGKSGFKMGALLAEPDDLDTAQKKAGAYGETMEAMAPTLKNTSIALGDLGDRWKKMYAAILLEIAPKVQEFVGVFKGANFSAIGKNIGAAAVGFAEFGKSIASSIQSIPWVGSHLAQIGIGFVALRTIGPLAGRAIVGALNGIGLACIRGQGAMGALAITWRLGWTSMAAATVAAVGVIKTALISTLVGAVIVAVGSALAWAWGKLQKFLDSGKSAKATDEATGKRVADYSEKIGAVSNEDERGALRDELTQEAINADQEAEAANKSDDPKEAAIRRRAEALRKLIETLEEVPASVMAANRAEREQKIAMIEAEKAAEELRKTVARLFDEYQKGQAKGALDAMPLDDAREKILRGFGPDMDEHAVGRGIELFKDSTDPRDLEHLQKLIEASKDLDAINKKRIDAANKATDAETESEEKIASLRAELSGNEALIRSLKAEHDLRQRIHALREAGVQNPVEKARAEVGLATSVEDKKRTEKLEDWRKKFGLEMQKLRAKAIGDTAGEKAAEREGKIDAYEKEAIGAGLEKPAAHAAAIARADAEAAAERKPAVAFADSDRRVGLGGIAVGSQMDPLVRASQEQTRALSTNSDRLAKLSDLIERNPKTLIKNIVGVFAP